MNIEVDNTSSLNGWIFFILQIYSIAYMVLSHFCSNRVSLLYKRAIQFQHSDLYSQITQQKNPASQSKLQEVQSTSLQANKQSKQLIQYINQLMSSISSAQGIKIECYEQKDQFLDFLIKKKYYQTIQSSRSIYKSYLNIIMQRYHFVLRLKSQKIYREWLLEISQMATYLILQISSLMLAEYISCLVSDKNREVENIDSTKICLYVFLNQITISPISILFAHCAYVNKSRSTQLYESIYQQSIEHNKQIPKKDRRFISSKYASIFQKLFSAINLLLLIGSSLEMGRFYENRQYYSNIFLQRVYIHIIITIYELLIGRFISSLFIGMIKIMLTKRYFIIHSTVVSLLIQFYQESLLQQNKYSFMYEEVLEEYINIMNGSINVEEAEATKQKQNLMSIVTLSQQPLLEKFNTLSSFNKRQVFHSNPNNQTISTSSMYKKNLTSNTKNIPSIYHLRQFTANKTMSDYENTYPVISSLIREETQITDNFPNTSMTKLDESLIKEEEKIPSKHIKDFQNQCCDLLNKNHNINSFSQYSDRNIKKVNSTITNQRVSLDNSISMNLLPLWEIDIPGLSKKSSNFIPILQSNSYFEGTQLTVQKDSKANQLSFLNHSNFSNSSHSHQNGKSNNHRTSVNTSFKGQKSTNSMQTTPLRQQQSMTKSFSKFSSLKSTSSLPKLNPMNISLNDHLQHLEQKGYLSSQESSGGLKILSENQQKEQMATSFQKFIDAEQQLVHYIEAKKKAFNDEKQQQKFKEPFSAQTQTIEIVKKHSSSNFLEQSDIKSMFNERLSIKTVNL